MKGIPPTIHGLLDYAFVLLLLLLPRLLGWSDSAILFLSLLGLTTLIYTAITCFKFGVFELIPMPVHLLLDGLGSLALLAGAIFLTSTTTEQLTIAGFAVFEACVVCFTQAAPPKQNILHQK